MRVVGICRYVLEYRWYCKSALPEIRQTKIELEGNPREGVKPPSSSLLWHTELITMSG